MTAGQKPIVVRPVRVHVQMGATVPTGNYSSKRFDYGLDADLEPGQDAHAAIKDLKAFVSRLLECDVRETLSGFTMTSPTSTLKVEDDAPELEPAFLDELPWKASDKTAGRQWIYIPHVPTIEPLASKLAQQPSETLEIGHYRYRLEGDKAQFVARYIRR